MKTNRKMFFGVSTLLILGAAAMLFFSFGVVNPPEPVLISDSHGNYCSTHIKSIAEINL